ncbi:hypothetical protein M087_4728 [Bacteroides fragilis str. S23 R14]|nr:hypothetical protein M087_4728 [Bacteroides fragilis str. S23 R14]EYA65494.1 hypothetical protein M139_3222 [Bacteroides fragilis str. S23L24]EYE43379.1 hypothetical protein M138_3169 [Bacteroides fragilis str. S23L17]
MWTIAITFNLVHIYLDLIKKRKIITKHWTAIYNYKLIYFKRFDKIKNISLSIQRLC